MDLFLFFFLITKFLQLLLDGAGCFILPVAALLAERCVSPLSKVKL